jgi:hypothetical protein
MKVRKMVCLFLLGIMCFIGIENGYAFTSTSHWDSVSDGWGCINRTRSGSYPEMHYSTEATSGTPDPSNALKITFPNGWRDAGEPAHCWNVFGSQNEEIYVQYYFKYSSGYQFHGVDNKQTYYWIGSGSVGNFYLSVNGSRKINMITQTYATNRHLPNTTYNPTIESGVWYKITARFKMNTPGALDGICQVWINDQLVINKNTIGYRSSAQAGIGFREMTITPVYGGSSGLVKTQTDYQWYDQVVISTEPLASSPIPMNTNSNPNPPEILNIN